MSRACTALPITEAPSHRLAADEEKLAVGLATPVQSGSKDT
jgi:hypothetical protein